MGCCELPGLIGESINAGKGLAILRIERLQKERPLSVIQRSRGATVLVGLPEFVVGAQELVDGEVWLYVETTADLVGCRGCGPGRRVMVGPGRRCGIFRSRAGRRC